MQWAQRRGRMSGPALPGRPVGLCVAWGGPTLEAAPSPIPESICEGVEQLLHLRPLGPPGGATTNRRTASKAEWICARVRRLSVGRWVGARGGRPD